MVAVPHFYHYENERLTGNVRPAVFIERRFFRPVEPRITLEVEVEQDVVREHCLIRHDEGKRRRWREATPEDLFQLKLSAEIR